MITVHSANGTRFAINSDLVEKVKESADTHVTLVGGAVDLVEIELCIDGDVGVSSTQYAGQVGLESSLSGAVVARLGAVLAATGIGDSRTSEQVAAVV